MAGLEAFARKQGWTLGEVFVEDQFSRPMVAWASLTVAARNLHVAVFLASDESVEVARQIAPVALLPPVRRVRRGPRPSAGIRRN